MSTKKPKMDLAYVPMVGTNSLPLPHDRVLSVYQGEWMVKTCGLAENLIKSREGVVQTLSDTDKVPGFYRK